jgi:hypothetical protein
MNPYSTGYDENLRVMEFAASTSEVTQVQPRAAAATTVVKPALPMTTMSGSIHRQSLTTRKVLLDSKPTSEPIALTPSGVTSWEVAESMYP